VSSKKVAIIQSNYIPWKGYFDIINQVDEFILLDEVQYTRSDWRNRNLIKTSDGLKWLTIPVKVKALRFETKINEVVVADNRWGVKHWSTIYNNYKKAPYFKQYKELFEELYLNNQELLLSRINFAFIKSISELLGIKTNISWSTDYSLVGDKNERLIELCKKTGATEYISGPAAKHYLNEVLFNEHQIEVRWIDYTGYKPYNQLYPPFAHNVSILDLIFCEGPFAKRYMKSFNAV
jgi:hypothetical protein